MLITFNLFSICDESREGNHSRLLCSSELLFHNDEFDFKFCARKSILHRVILFPAVFLEGEPRNLLNYVALDLTDRSGMPNFHRLFVFRIENSRLKALPARAQVHQITSLNLLRN